MDPTSDPIRVFQTQRSLNFTPQEVFRAFSDPKRLEAWWGPKGFTNSFEIFEFQENGLWKFSMHAPTGEIYPNQCIFREIEIEKKIVIEHVVQPLFTLSIDLINSQGNTVLLWTQKFEDAGIAQAMSQIVKKANEENLDRLTLNLSENK